MNRLASSINERARILKAMGHPSRLLILDALSGGERCVCVLQELVASDISTVSKHLSLLKAAGLVIARKEGLWVHYRLRMPCIMQFMTCLAAVIDGASMPACRCEHGHRVILDPINRSVDQVRRRNPETGVRSKRRVRRERNPL